METVDEEISPYTGYNNYTISERINGYRDEQNISPTFGDIGLPSNFKTVIMKLHPEISDVVAVHCKIIKKYNPNTFDPVAYFQVGVKVFFPQDGVPKGNKEYYKKSFDELFIMTYGGEMDFVSFNVISLVVPPPKSNEEKFLELFGKK